MRRKDPKKHKFSITTLLKLFEIVGFWMNEFLMKDIVC